MERESSVKISATVYKQLEEQTKTVAYTDNGTYNVSPDPGYFLSNVNVEVHVDQNLSVISELSAVISGLNDQIATITSLTIVENGTYTPPEGVLGYNSINVNVVGGGEDFTAISALSLNFTNNEPLPEQYYSLFNNVLTLYIKGDINPIEFKSGNLTQVEYIGLSLCGELTSVTFPNGALTNIKSLSSSFYSCFNLRSLTFPEGSLTQVSYLMSAFRGCSLLSSIYFPNGALTQVNLLNNTFSSCSSLTSVTFPEGSLTLVTGMGSTFQRCRSLSFISFPEGSLREVKSMGSTFSGCTSLLSIYFPEGALTQATQIIFAFSGCTSLKDLTIYNLPNINLTNTGFTYCTSLTLQSLQNILNALPVTTSSYKCTLGTTNLSKLSEEQIAIATNKGWTLN